MTADVYAGDDDLNRPRSGAHAGLGSIRLQADADADIMLRVAAQLSYLNHAPTRLLLPQRADGLVLIEIELRDCGEQLLELIRRKLERLTSVREVAAEYRPA